jgi:hypothetical protein
MSIIGDIDKAIDTVVGDIEGATSNVVTPPSVIKGHNQYTLTLTPNQGTTSLMNLGSGNLVDITIQLINPSLLPPALPNVPGNNVTFNMIYWKNELTPVPQTIDNQNYSIVKKNTPLQQIYVTNKYSVSVTILINYTTKQYTSELENGIEEGTTSITGTVNIGSFPLVPVTVQQQPISTPVNVDNGALFAVPIILSNTQTSATPISLPILIPINPSTYASSEDTYLRNINFQDGNGNILKSWLESGGSSTQAFLQPTNTSTFARYWVQLNVSIPALSQITIYLCLYSTSTVVWDGINTGVAYYITANGLYINGQYDNGSNVFQEYQAWGLQTGLPPGWSTTNSPTLAFSSQYTTLSSGSPSWAGVYRTSTLVDKTQPVVSDVFMSNNSLSTTTFGSGWVNGTLAWDTGAYKTIGSLSSQTASSLTVLGDVNGTITNSFYPATNSLNSIAVWSVSDISNGFTKFNYIYTNVLTSTTTTTNVNLYYGVAVSDVNTTLQLYWTRTRIIGPNGNNPSIAIGQLQNSLSVSNGFVPFTINLTEIGGIPISSSAGIPVSDFAFSIFDTSQYPVGTSATQLPILSGVNAILKADETNTVRIFVGGSSGVTTLNGFPLTPGSSVTVSTNNLANMWVISQISGQVVDIFYEVG